MRRTIPSGGAGASTRKLDSSSLTLVVQWQNPIFLPWWKMDSDEGSGAVRIRRQIIDGGTADPAEGWRPYSARHNSTFIRIQKRAAQNNGNHLVNLTMRQSRSWNIHCLANTHTPRFEARIGSHEGFEFDAITLGDGRRSFSRSDGMAATGVAHPAPGIDRQSSRDRQSRNSSGTRARRGEAIGTARLGG